MALTFSPIGGNNLCFGDPSDARTAAFLEAGELFGYNGLAP
jgi:hypothetical protein